MSYADSRTHACSVGESQVSEVSEVREAKHLVYNVGMVSCECCIDIDRNLCNQYYTSDCAMRGCTVVEITVNVLS